MLTIGSLFSGIGGLELGLERAGLGPVLWQCEIEPFCRRVLAKHWPNVTRFVDVTQPRNYPHVDLICGGFPCQDLSPAGARRGIGGSRSGLWYHYADIVARVRPRFVVVENSGIGSAKWLPHVRHALHMLGYSTRAFALSAADVGALHWRPRCLVVADAYGDRQFALPVDAEVGGSPPVAAHLAGHGKQSPKRRFARRGQATVQDRIGAWRPSGWDAQPNMVRMVHGVSRRLDGARRRALGNAVVPQVAEAIGRIIVEGMNRHG